MGRTKLAGELERDIKLLRSIGDAWREGAKRSGRLLACRPGCFECCIGPFAINALDARRLRRGLERLYRSDPQRHAAVLHRAEKAVQLVGADFPGDPRSGQIIADEASEESFYDRFGEYPCPALDPQNGLCELYDERPLSCRSHGPPVRIGATELPPCRLCYKGIPEEDYGLFRVELDRERDEQAILADLEVRGISEGETIVAFALLRDTWE